MLLLLVDDVECLDLTPVGDVLARVLADDSGAGVLVVAAGCTPELLSRFQGLCVELRRHGTGVVLGPAGPADGDVLGVRLPRREVRRPGRGVLVHRGTSTMVQVAHPGGGPQQSLTNPEESA